MSRARREVARNPTPQNVEQLCRTFINNGDHAEALLAAEEGLARFPDAEKLLTVRKYLKRQECAHRIAELKEALRERPSPILYRQLAELYREVGDDQKALDTCLEVQERYPKDENTYLVMGDIYFERFTKSYLASDGESALRNLRRVCELNRNNYTALLKLAQIYLELGRFSRAIPHLKSIINFAPSDATVKSLLRRSQELSAVEEETDEDIDFVLRAVEERERPFFRVIRTSSGADLEPVRVTQRESLDLGRLSEEFHRTPTGHDFRAWVGLDREGNLIAYNAIPEIDIKLVADIAKDLISTLCQQPQKIGLGNFRRCSLESPTLGLTIHSEGPLNLLVLVAPEVRPEYVEKEVMSLAGRLLS